MRGLFLSLGLLLAAPVQAGDACDDSADTRVVQLGWGFTNVWAVSGAGGTVLVDAHNPGAEERLIKQLERADISRDEVTLVLVTHGHADHTGSAEALGELLDVPVAIGAPDLEAAEAGHDVTLGATDFRGRTLARLLDHSFAPFTPDLVVEESLDLSDYGVSATARHVGGHTPGSMVVELEDGRALVSDLIRGGMIRRHKPTLHFFQHDPVTSDAALVEVAREATCLLPGHGKSLKPERTLRWVERKGHAP